MMFLTHEEKNARTPTIPWERIEPRIRNWIVKLNAIPGVSTVQSCAGHIKPDYKEGIAHVVNGHVALRLTKKLTARIIFHLSERVPGCSIRIYLDFFDNSMFWLTVEFEPNRCNTVLEQLCRLLAQGKH